MQQIIKETHMLWNLTLCFVFLWC